jgi:DNA-binding CsgD family transcriptional regulator
MSIGMATAMRPEVIGRDHDLDAIRAFLAARDDLPAALVIEGEPGIGKTVLLRRAIAEASSYRTVIAAPIEAERDLLFNGLMDLLEAVLEPAVADLPPPQRHALEVALLRRDAAGSDPDPRAIGAGVLGVVRALARGGPVLVAVDDVQWLDTASAQALSYAVRRLQVEPVALLLGRRLDPTDMSPLLQVSVPPERLTKIRLGPLSVGAVQRILRERLGDPLARPVLRRVWQASGGNPLFALEIAQALRSHAPSGAPTDPLPIPETLATTVQQRVGALPRASLNALRLVAVASTPTLALLGRALGEDPETVLQPGQDAGLINLEGDRIRFVHPLFASAVYSMMNEPDRRDLHRRLAGLVERPEERARHLARAANEPDEAIAATLERAARQARSRGAPSAAAELSEEAVRLTPAAAAESAQKRRIDAAAYRFEAGDTERAQKLLAEAVSSAPPGWQRAEALIRLARIHLYGDRTKAVGLFEQALVEEEGNESIRLDAEEGLALCLFFMRREIPAAEEHAREAVVLARELDDPRKLAIALGTHGLIQGLLGRPEAADSLESAIALDAHARGARVLTQPVFNLAVVAFWTDDLERCLSLLREAHDRAAAYGDDSSLPFILGYRSLVEWTLGRWPEATTSAEEAFEVALRTEQEAQEALALGSRALVAASRGDEHVARAAAEQALALAREHDAMVATTTATWALGLLDLSLQRPAEAHARLGPLIEQLEAAGVGEPGSMRFVMDDIEGLVMLGRLEEAGALLDRTEARARQLNRGSVLAACARSRGLLAAAQGRIDVAEEALHGALREHGGTAMPFERARTLFALGSLLRRTGRKRNAREALEEALDQLERLGAALWTEQVRDELRRIGGRAPSRGGLTPTEEKVAALVAEGRTNREAAAALFVTERTVEYHLGNIYRKLGLRSRAELARRVSSAAARGPVF